MNHTGDTLLLTVRYRLDSAVVSASDVPRLRQAQTADSLALPHLRIGGHQPLDHLVRHQGHWYWVRNAYATTLPYWSDASGNLHPAATNRTAGVITYKLVPGGGHEVAAQLCQPSCDTLPPALPPLVSLRLQQGRAQRALPIGTELNTLFQAQFSFWHGWLEWGPTTYRYELCIGPGLVLDDN